MRQEKKLTPKETSHMKYLKIEDNKGLYQTGSNDWVEIDKISKDDLLILLDKAVDTDFEMDEFVPENVANKAHSIIYKHLYSKFSELVNNKNRFKDESEQMYKTAIDKYTEAIQSSIETQPSAE